MSFERLIGRGAAAAAAGAVAVLACPGLTATVAQQEEQAGPPAEPAISCPEGRRVGDIQPQEAIVARLHGKDARIFVESCLASGPGAPTAPFDTVLVLSGPEVFGGTVAVAAQGECSLGHKFLGLVEFIHAEEMVGLYQRHPALAMVEHLDLEVLTPLAEAGEAAAAFHVGFVKAMGWGAKRDRADSIAWLRRAAEADYEPGMLALGMSLAGPGVIDEQLLPVGKERPRDAGTDLAGACYWLQRLARLEAASAYSGPARYIYEQEVAPRLTPKEKKACRALLKERRK